MDLTFVEKSLIRPTNLLSHPKNLPQSVTSPLKVALHDKNGMIHFSHLFGGACEDRASSSALNSAVHAQDLARLAH